MIIIPAIYVRHGNSVKLKQGEISTETINSTDPVFIAKLWRAKGAKRIHVVDLDGVFSGTNINKNIIRDICSSVDVPVEVGGGMRTMDKIKEAFNIGASYVILGTVAIHNPEIVKTSIEKYGSEKIIVAIDAKNGRVAVDGWKDLTFVGVLELANKLEKMGVREIIHTDIFRDGMLIGPNFIELEKLSESSLNLIVSGGIKTIDDLIKLKKYKKKQITGVVMGSALHTNDFKLEEAIKTLDNL
jgi:phosphoribosylformimino-5-aminoimidazole carboxamide ribotide isomerase